MDLFKDRFDNPSAFTQFVEEELPPLDPKYRTKFAQMVMDSPDPSYQVGNLFGFFDYGDMWTYEALFYYYDGWSDKDEVPSFAFAYINEVMSMTFDEWIDLMIKNIEDDILGEGTIMRASDFGVSVPDESTQDPNDVTSDINRIREMLMRHRDLYDQMITHYQSERDRMLNDFSEEELQAR